MNGDSPVVPRTDRPHSARMYDYLLGGRDYYAADSQAAENALAAAPTLRIAAQENRKFIARAVRHLVLDVGIRQFIDLGPGLPTTENVHQVAQEADPEARVVYVDNDPIVLAFGGAMLEQNERTTVVHGDIRDPLAVLHHPRTREQIDPDEPVGVLAVAVLHFIRDEDDPAGIVRALADVLAPGSHFVLSHGTADISPQAAMGVQAAYRSHGVPLTLRSKERFGEFFTGLELIEPGIQIVSEWRATEPEAERPSCEDVSWYGGVGRL
ncbi:SAM-dependent methyltransferase [Streptomyces marincola]|uniref:SAM-dependent methyltransferase n=1 Tax=Streptomyces marincola TaxID=2878388 RepID=UPI001CF41368|nr:SAM-dependent methyltransferase [Streptomyces marincola]UCM87647.1 SAM-dependent methyltransferase [Streptomyces marincola]